jgi:phage shock protein E
MELMRFRRELQWLALVVFAVSTLGIAACGLSASTVEGSLPDYDPALAYKLVTEEHALLLDVRTPQEYQQGHVPSAKNIPIQEFSSRLHEIEVLAGGDKTHPIVVYCESGGRAARAKRILAGAGFTKVTNLGGLRDWPSH